MKCKCKCGCGAWEDKEKMIQTPAGRFLFFSHAIEFANEKAAATAARNAAKARSAQKKQDKIARAAHKEKVIELKPKKWHRERAKRAVQDYRRISLIFAYLRAGEAPKCISCGTTVTMQWQAGHYRPAGVNSALMFELDNIWLQCKECNEHKSGNLTLYRINLIEEIGEARVLELENNHEVKKWSIHEFTEITNTYREKLRELKKDAPANYYR